MQLRCAAGRVDIVARRAGEAGVQDADIDGVRGRLLEFRQQALRRLWLGEAEAVQDDVQRARTQLHRLGPPAEHLDGRRQDEFLRDARHRIMIAPHLEDLDAGAMQALHLARQEARRLHRGLVAIIEIASDDERVDLLFKAQVDNGDQRPPRGVADQLRKVAVTQSEGAQRRIEVDVGGMDETERHGGTIASHAPARLAIR